MQHTRADKSHTPTIHPTSTSLDPNNDKSHIPYIPHRLFPTMTKAPIMESRGSRDELERSDRYDTNNSSRIIRTAVFGNIIPCLNQLPPGICYHLLDLWDEFVSMPAGIVRLERPVTRSRYYYWCVSYMLNEIFGSVTPYLETTMERPMQP